MNLNDCYYKVRVTSFINFKTIKMKKIIGCFLIVTSLLATSCSENDDVIEEIVNSELNYTAQISPNNTPNFSTNEIIVQFKNNVSPLKKAILRQQHQVIDYEICTHCNGTIEKWDFGPNIDLENKLGSVSSGSGGAESIQNVMIEFNFEYETDYFELIGGSEDYSYTSNIVTQNDGVTIAVLDSGIDVNYPSFGSSPFLYNAASDGISGVNSGWDYVNENHNSYDDYKEVHGTAVSAIIYNSLMETGIPFQLLPVKIADEDGMVSVFNMLCGMLYSLPKADIIQLSLGWYEGAGSNPFTTSIFLDLLHQYDDVLIVTSAGNSDNNNDGNIAHYPSNFSMFTPNVIGIGATDKEITDSAYFTNYGAHSVDFLSIGTDIPFINRDGDPVFISGTSFSAPYVTAMAARILYQSGMTYTPAVTINALNTNGIDVNFSKETKYEKFIPPLY